MSSRYPGVYKRGTTWSWRAQFQRDGERHGISGSGYTSAKEAWEAKQTALRQATESPDEVPDLTLGEWADRWLEDHVPTVRESTASGYRSKVKMLHETSADRLVLKDLTEADVKRLVTELRAQSPAHSTLKLKVSTLDTILNAAVRAGLLRTNPLPNIHIARTAPTPTREPWTVTEAQQFLRERRKDDDPLFHVWHLALTTGLRMGELHGLQWDDVDGHLVHVRRQRQQIRGRVVEGLPKTSGSEAPVVVDQRTLEILDEVPHVSEYVVTDPRTGRPYHRIHTFRSDFYRACDAAGVRRIRFHDLRHTSASLLANAGVPLVQAQARLRHWSPAMTAHYTKADPTAGLDVAEKLGDLLA